MRKTFIETIINLAETDKNIYLLTGDLGFSIFKGFAEKFPKRFINCGIAEQNMMGVAAGLAIEGKKPYVYSIAPFVTMRCFEQIRNDICYQNLNVKIIGMGAGFSYGADDFTHYAIEDLSILKSLPNLMLLSPADLIETKELVLQSYSKKQPTYIRLDKSGKMMHNGRSKIIIGKPFVFKDGKNAVLITTGTCLEIGISVAKKLESEGFSLKIISMHTIKPIDEKLLVKETQGQKIVFTLEEHSVAGGLGSSVAEILLENHIKNITFEKLGVPDDHKNIIGKQSYLKKHYGIDEAIVYRKIFNAIKTNEK